MVVELAILLDKNVYDCIKLVEAKTKINDIAIYETNDEYYSNIEIKKLRLLSELEIKESCIRVRNVKKRGLVNKLINKYSIQNMKLVNKDNINNVNKKTLNNTLKELEKDNCKSVLKTHKTDYQIFIDNKERALQFQMIDDIGLVLYYDNKKYYGLPIMEQKKKLIDDLKELGFDCTYETKNLYKLKSLLCGIKILGEVEAEEI